MKDSQLTLLGSVQLHRDGEPLRPVRRKSLAVLAYLLVENRPIPRDTLADLFWPQHDLAKARRNLSWTLNNIETALPQIFNRDGETVRFAGHDVLACDALWFAASENSASAQPLQQAADSYQGLFMAGLSLRGCAEFEQWQGRQQEAWQQRYFEVLARLVVAWREAGDLEQALRVAELWRDTDLWQERAWREMLELLALLGKVDVAEAQFARLQTILRDDLGAEPSAETLALMARIRPNLTGSKSRLPHPSTRIIGRGADVAKVVGRLERRDRLVTVLGEGGIGKTQLALTIAHQMQPQFANGAVFVSLAEVSGNGESPTLVRRIANQAAVAAGVLLQPDRDAVEQLFDRWRDATLFVVLDNFEHLVAGASFVRQLLTACGSVTVLATSRTRLGLSAEKITRLQGLNSDTDDPLDAESVRLFIERARQRDDTFTPTQAELIDLHDICRRLGGSPLGIELAAGQIEHFTITELASALRDRDYDLLEADQRDVPDRQRTLRGVFEWSWRLLSAENQQALARLSVFRGQFDRAAALKVAGAKLANLRALVDGSFLRTVGAGRYELHVLVGQFSAEKLTDRHHTERAHALYFTQLLHRSEKALVSAELTDSFAKLNQVASDILHAMHIAGRYRLTKALDQSLTGFCRYIGAAVAEVDGIEILTAILTSLSDADAALGTRIRVEAAMMLRRTGRIDEALALLVDEDNHAGVLLIRGGLAVSQGRPDLAESLVRAAMEQAEQDDDIETAAQSTHQLAVLLIKMARYDEAFNIIERGKVHYRRIDHQIGIAQLTGTLGFANFDTGDYKKAYENYRRSWEMFVALSYPSGQAFALSGMGVSASMLHDLMGSLEIYRRAYDLAKRLHDTRSITLTLHNLGVSYARLGANRQARSYYMRSLKLCRQHNKRDGKFFPLINLGLLHQHLGELDDALVCHREALAICQQGGMRGYEGLALQRLGQDYLKLGQLDKAEELLQRATDIHSEVNKKKTWQIETTGVQTQVALARHDVPTAHKLSLQLYETLITHTLHGMREPLLLLHTCYAGLSAANDLRAGEILSLAQKHISRFTASITDPELRHTFQTEPSTAALLQAIMQAKDQALT